jgi:hypothetical protein
MQTKVKRPLRGPAIKDVAAALARINDQRSPRGPDDGRFPVRLRVFVSGNRIEGWRVVRAGQREYDSPPRGYMGDSSVPGNRQPFDAAAIARDLIEQVHAEWLSRP